MRNLTLILFLCTTVVLGQEATYTLTAWKVEDGLPQGSVRCVTQTRDGYLWAGTWNGLARFDGVRFTNFHSANTPALTSSSITSLCADNGGALWIGTDGGGAVRYDGGTFTRFDATKGVPAKRIMDISQDRTGRIWFSTELGFYAVDGSKVLHFSEKDGLISSYAGSVHPCPDGSFYLGMVNFASHVRLIGDSLAILDTFPVGGFRIDVDSIGRLWYFLPHTGLVRREGNRAIIDGRFVSGDPRDVFITGQQRWIATSRGIYILRGSDVQLVYELDGVILDRVVVVFKDREDNFWLSNTGRGLLRLRPKHVQAYAKRTGFASDFVMSGHQDDRGHIWIGTWDQGLFRSRVDPTSAQRVILEPVRIGTGTPSIVDIKEFRDGSLWLGVWGSGLHVMRHGRVERPRVAWKDGEFSVTSIAEDADGSAWIGTAHSGVLHRKGSTEVFWDTDRGLSSNEIAVVMRTRNGDLWVGTSGGGANRISNGHVSSMTTREGLSNDYVSTIIEDAEGTIWIATARGLNRWKPGDDKRPGTLAAITQRHGLYDDATNQLIEDRDNLWIGSIHGIFRVKKQELHDVADGVIDRVTCLRIGRSDGMLSEECGARGNSRAWRTSDGRLWFSTSGGAVAFDPRLFEFRSTPPEVILEEVAIDNSPASFGEEIVLQPGQSRLDVRYTGINFSAPQSVRFRYIMEGFEGAWNDAGQERIAHYTNIDPGTYTLRVTASNHTGIWNDVGASVRVTVLPPFWRTWWFRIVAFILVVGVIGWTIRSIEIRKIRARVAAIEREAALERQRLRIARDLHDELGARLTEIGLMTDLARSGTRSKARKGNLDEIGSAARGVVDSFREVVWTVSPQQDSLASLTDFVEQYATRFLKRSGIGIRFNVPADLPNVVLRSDERHSIFMIVKESLNNVVKHAHAKEVTLSVDIVDQKAAMSIADDGRGFSQSAVRRTSNGLDGMKRRLSDSGGSVEITSALKHGTTVKIVIPLYHRTSTTS